MVGSSKKRKSMDPTELAAHSSAKKERNTKWYQEEAERTKDVKREKKKFFSSIGGLLTRMRSGSKLVTESTSRLPRMEALIPEGREKEKKGKENATPVTKQDAKDTSIASSVESVPVAVKRNAHLKSMICEISHGHISYTTSEGDHSRSTGSFDDREQSSVTSSEVSGMSEFVRGTDLRGSSRSMPAPSSVNRDNVVRRANSTACDPSSPLSHYQSPLGFSRRSARLSRRPTMMESLLEEEGTTDNAGSAVSSTRPITPNEKGDVESSTPSASDVKFRPSENGVHTPLSLHTNLHTYSTSEMVTPTQGTPGNGASVFTPDTSGTASGGKLKRCSASGSTLSRLWKRGFSSGSRALTTNTTPVVRVTRRDTMDSSRMKSEMKKRRASDVTGYAALQRLNGFTPVDTMQTNRNREKEKVERFSERVKVSDRLAQEEVKSKKYNTIVIDSMANGRPISHFSGWVLDYLGITADAQETIKNVCYDRFAKATVIPAGEGHEDMVLAVGLVRDHSNLPMVTRIGYDAAIAKTCEKKSGLRVLCAPAFFPFQTPYNLELAEAMLRTLYRTVANNCDKIESVTLAATNEEEKVILQQRMQMFMEEKRGGLSRDITVRREESM